MPTSFEVRLDPFVYNLWNYVLAVTLVYSFFLTTNITQCQTKVDSSYIKCAVWQGLQINLLLHFLEILNNFQVWKKLFPHFATLTMKQYYL